MIQSDLLKELAFSSHMVYNVEEIGERKQKSTSAIVTLLYCVDFTSSLEMISFLAVNNDPTRFLDACSRCLGPNTKEAAV